MRVLVTGAGGYLGAAVVREFIQLPSVTSGVAFDNFSRQNFSFLLDPIFVESKKISVVMADILDSRSLRAAMEGCEVVVHLAGVTPTPSNVMDAHVFDQVNNWGLASIVAAANDVLPEMVLYSSSVSVYGTSEREISVGEEPAPNDAYGVSKLDGERQLQALDSRVSSQVVRLGNLYGLSNQARFDSLVNRMVLDAKYRGLVLIEGSGDQARPVLPIETAARFFASAVTGPFRSTPPTALFAESPSVSDIADIILQTRPATQVRFVNRGVRLPSLRLKKDSTASREEDILSSNIPSILGSLT